jgi:hypothetical protein
MMFFFDTFKFRSRTVSAVIQKRAPIFHLHVMKYCFLIFSFLQVLSAQTNGVPTGVRLTPSPELPSIVNERFRRDFPNVRPDWQQAGDNFTATFLGDSTHLPVTVVYSGTGELLARRSRLQKGSYPQAIDQYYSSERQGEAFDIWREDNKDKAFLYFGVTRSDTLWFGVQGNYLQDMNRKSGNLRFTEKDKTLFMDIVQANYERMALLSQAGDNKSGINKEQLAVRCSRVNETVHNLGSARGVDLPDPFLPAVKKTAPSEKEFRKLDKRLNCALKKASKKAEDKELRALSANLLRLEQETGTPPTYHGAGKQ